MEAHGCRELPARQRPRALRRASRCRPPCSTASCRASPPSSPRPRAGRPRHARHGRAARGPTCRRARTTASSSPPRSPSLQAIWRTVLGADDMRALDDLYARVIWVPDGENDRARPRRRASTARSSARPTRRRHARRRRRPTAQPRARRAATGRRLPTADVAADALEQLERGSRDRPAAARRGLDLRHARAAPARRPAARRAAPARARRAGRMPDRGVDRPPSPDEIQQARRYATRLRRALATARGGSTSAPPADASTAAPTRAAKRSARPGARSARTRGRSRATSARRSRQPHVALIIDTSGSMSAYEYALGPIAWILTDGLRRSTDARDRAVRQRRQPAQRRHATRCRTCPGSAPAAAPPSPATRSRSPPTNSRWPTAAARASVRAHRRRLVRHGGRRARRSAGCAEHGVPTIHLSIGAEPLSVEAGRICVLTDPADALDLIAADTVAALPPPPRRPAP